MLMDTMTGKERIMTALKNGEPDRVPATPDISIMIPCRLTEKPFWEIELMQDPSLSDAYIQAAKYFGIDGWMFNGTILYKNKSDISVNTKILFKDKEKYEVLITYNTPDGDLELKMIYPRDNPSTIIVKPIKNIKEDFNKYKHFYSDIISYDDSTYKEQKKSMGDLGMICCWIEPPGFQNYFSWMSMEQITYGYYDHPEIFEEIAEMYDRVAIQKTEMAIDAGVESILTGGSGSLTLQSPELFRKLSLPTIKKIAKMCKEAGIISGVHSCGKERYLIEACANETDLDYVNPLEIDPMGDCDLAEIKKSFGDNIAIMGNLHTTDVMLNGTVDDVKRESLKAILNAGLNGGFVLSTGDQCGRDTPDENIFAMVEVVKEFGQYPLDIDKIQNELKRSL